MPTLTPPVVHRPRIINRPALAGLWTFHRFTCTCGEEGQWWALHRIPLTELQAHTDTVMTEQPRRTP